MRTLANYWEEFSDCIPSGAEDAQRKDMKAAFYAGAATIFAALVNGVTVGDEVNPADLVMMDTYHNEIKAFTAALKTGKV